MRLLLAGFFLVSGLSASRSIFAGAVNYCANIGSGCYTTTTATINTYSVWCPSSAPPYSPVIAGSCGIFYDAQREPAGNNPKNQSPDRACGSIVQVDNRSVGESIPIAGTGETLNYFSDRVVGRIADYSFILPVVDDPIDTNITNIKVTANWEGQQDIQNITPTTGAVYDFVWDGKNQYGNFVNRATEINVGVLQEYTNPADNFSIFYKIIIGRWRAQQIGLGGWTFSSHNYYDSLSKIIYYGNGRERQIEALGIVINGSGQTEVPTSTPITHYMVTDDQSDQAFIFGLDGKHLETRSIKTGRRLFEYQYDIQGRLKSITDAFGNETEFQQVSSSEVHIVAPFGQTTVLTLDGDGWLVELADPVGKNYEMTYVNADGLLETFKKPEGAISTFTYDLNGKLDRDDHSAGAFLKFIETAINNNYGTMNMSTAEGRQTSYTNYFNNGSWTRLEVHPSGQTETFQDSPGSGFSYQYDSQSTYGEQYIGDNRLGPSYLRRTGAFHYSGTQALSSAYQIQNQVYNSSDLLLLTSETEKITIDSKDWYQAYEDSTKTTTWTSPLGVTSKIKINNYDQPIETTHGTFSPVVYTYDAYGRVKEVDQSARNWTLAYGVDGFVSSITDPLSQTQSFTYDDNGQILTTTLPDARVIEYAYDGNGNRIGIKPPAKPWHDFVFNLFDLIAEYLFPNSATPADKVEFEYNLDKQLTKITKPGNQIIDFNYGSTTGLLDSIDTPEGTYNRTYDYYGVLTQMTSPNSVTLDLLYDGNLISELKTTYTSVTSKVIYTFQKFLQKTRVLNINGSDSASITYNYNDDRKLSQAGSLTVSRSNTHGFITGTTLDNITEELAYDATYGELNSYKAKFSGIEFFKETYVRDGLGRISQKTVVYNSTTHVFDYHYDSTGRLEQVDLNSTTQNDYVYDTNSNRTQKTNVSTGTANLTYDSQDRLLTNGSETYTYTPHGELASKTNSSTGISFTYTYNSLGTLTQMVRQDVTTDTFTYVYDGWGRRVKKSKNGNLERHYIYDELNRLVGELDASQALEIQYIYGTKAHSPDYIIKSGTRYKLIHDQVGSIRLVVNSSTGAIVSEQDFDEFGNLTSSSSPDFQSLGFAGGMKVDYNQFYRFGARDYDPEVGRWVSKDPILFAGGDTNLYGYVENDPINWIDSEGEAKSSITDNTAAGPVASGGGIRGFTRHGGNRAIGDGSGRAGVSPRAMNDAVKNPMCTRPESGGGTRFDGRDATVILNSNGTVRTTWPTSTRGVRGGK